MQILGHVLTIVISHTKSSRIVTSHTDVRHITHRNRPFVISHTGREVSTVYTPSFDISHTLFRQFTHRPFPIRQQHQRLVDDYPQRNSL